MNNSSTNTRSAARYGEGEYRIVSADGDRENVLASSDNAGVFEKLLKLQANIGGGRFDKVCHI